VKPKLVTGIGAVAGNTKFARSAAPLNECSEPDGLKGVPRRLSSELLVRAYGGWSPEISPTMPVPSGETRRISG
jgi:hypothetical protein